MVLLLQFQLLLEPVDLSLLLLTLEVSIFLELLILRSKLLFVFVDLVSPCVCVLQRALAQHVLHRSTRFLFCLLLQRNIDQQFLEHSSFCPGRISHKASFKAFLKPELLHWAPSKVSERNRNSRALVDHSEYEIPNGARVKQGRRLVSSPEVFDAFARDDILGPPRIASLRLGVVECVILVSQAVVLLVRLHMSILHSIRTNFAALYALVVARRYVDSKQP